jgi:hypothetical protein
MTPPGGTAHTLATVFELFADGTDTSYGSERYLELVAPTCDWRESSNDARFDGRSGDRAALQLAGRQSAHLLRRRGAAVSEMFVDGDRAAVLWTWSAVRADDGSAVVARVFSAFTVRQNLIHRWHDHILT